VKAIKLITANLVETVKNNNNIEGRKMMAWGSMIAGMAFAQTGVGVAHSISHPLGALFQIPHGLACAILLPVVIDYNGQVCMEKYQEIVDVLGYKGEFSSYLRKMIKQLPLPQTLTEAGYKEGQEEKLVTATFDTRSIKNNPRMVEGKDVRAILEKCI
jgi:lactaldehyde reductase